MTAPSRALTRAQIDRSVAKAWDRGCWTLTQFVRVTRLPERTIEESCIRLYKIRRINFDPPIETSKKGPTHGNRKQPKGAKPRGRARKKAVKIRRDQSGTDS